MQEIIQKNTTYHPIVGNVMKYAIHRNIFAITKIFYSTIAIIFQFKDLCKRRVL